MKLNEESKEINEKEISNHKCSMEKKSWKLLKILKQEMNELQLLSSIKDEEILKFSNFTNFSRKDYSSNFYHICVLASKGFVDVYQKESFGEIEIKKGKFFNK